MQRSDNVALLPNSIIDYNFTPNQAIGDLGGTGHVVCIDLKQHCPPRPPVVDYMDNAGLAIRTIIDI
ncbi:unnamed protein product [Clavelina lepadiformis]|uniref:Uncharacterized protein n=1 Tax=Clavelina lepadiformis TaxID=159417 RepID=A0ABP0FPJ9_CLALP